MPGLAITDDFMLGTATIMIGAQEDLYDLDMTNSIGLVKNFTITTQPTYTELTQGVQNTVVHSTMTGNPVNATMEAYEFSARNLGVALGLEGATELDEFAVSTTTSSSIVSPSTTIPVAAVTGFAAGDYIMIFLGNTAEDDVVVRRLTGTVASPESLTADVTVPAMASGKTVKKVNMLGVGVKDNQPFYSAKIVGVLANGDKCVLMIPKLRVTKGFSLAFSTQQYGNLPLEFTLYDQVSTDPNYGAFDGAMAGLLRT